MNLNAAMRVRGSKPKADCNFELKFLLGCFVICGVLLAPLQAQHDKDPKYIKKRAERMMAQFDYDSCLKYLNLAAKNLPKDGEILIMRGELHFLMEHFDEAALDYEAGLELVPELRARITNLPLALVRASRLDEASAAAEALMKAAVDDHGRANGRFILGLIAWHRGDLEKASRELKLAVDSEPRMPKAWYRYGLVLLHEKEFKLAAQAFERVLELDRLHHAAAYNLSLAALRAGDKERAESARRLQLDILAVQKNIQTIRANLEKTPRNKDLLRRIADIYFDFEAYFEAAPIYAAVTAADPEDLAPRLRFAECKYQTRDYHDARVQTRIILERDPGNEEARRIQDAILGLIGEEPQETPAVAPKEEGGVER